jgi:hypothetical protein
MTFLGGAKMTEEYKKLEKEKVEKIYEMFLESFLFGKLGVTKDNYKKYEQAICFGSVFNNSKEYFICNFIYHLTCLSRAKIFLEVEKNSLEGIEALEGIEEGINLFRDLRNTFEEIVLDASHQDLSEEEEEEISGILSDILTEHLSVSYKLRKKNHEIIRRKK